MIGVTQIYRGMCYLTRQNLLWKWETFHKEINKSSFANKLTDEILIRLNVYHMNNKKTIIARGYVANLCFPIRWVHTMNVCSSVGQRLKSLINEPKRRRNYVREKDIFHSHYERCISGAIQLLRTFPSVWLRLTAFASAWQRLSALYLFSISVCELLPTQM